MLPVECSLNHKRENIGQGIFIPMVMHNAFSKKTYSVNNECCCADVVDVRSVSRRRCCGCAQWSVVRRCSTRIVVVASLFIFFTLTTMFTSPSSIAAYRDPDDAYTLASRSSSSTSVVLFPPAAHGRPGSDASATSTFATAAVLLATPDCDAIIAGDRAEIASTRRMLFRETRTSSTLNDDGRGGPTAVNCTSAFRPRAASDVHGQPAFPPLSYIVISEADADVEQAELLLRAIYAASNFYCVILDVCSASEHVGSSTLRRLMSCFNVVTVERRARCNSTESRDRKWNATTATTTAWWRCVDRLLRLDVDWSHVISLAVGDFPLRPRDDIARRLTTTHQFQVGRRTGNDVIRCGAYSRSAVSQPPTLRSNYSEADSESSIATTRIHSPDGATAIEVCARKCTVAVEENNNNARCYYTVADLPSLVRQRKLFAHAFNLNVDHYAVRCLMQRIVK